MCFILSATWVGAAAADSLMLDQPLTAWKGPRDESLVGEERLKISMLIPVLDQLTMQLKERFGDKQVHLMKEIALFASGALKRGAAISQQTSRI